MFPLPPDHVRGQSAARAALDAARRALEAIEEMNHNPPSALAAIKGWNPLRTGIALHEGKVFFGNVGTVDRLDFTVIGRAVNEASRVEALSKSLKRNILVTEPVARRLDVSWEDLGRHSLRGVAEPVTILSPIQDNPDV